MLYKIIIHYKQWNPNLINSKLLKTKLMMIHRKIPQIQLTASPSIETNLKRNIHKTQRRKKKTANTTDANTEKNSRTHRKKSNRLLH